MNKMKNETIKAWFIKQSRIRAFTQDNEATVIGQRDMTSDISVVLINRDKLYDN